MDADDVYVHWIEEGSPVLDPTHPDTVVTFLGMEGEMARLRGPLGDEYLVKPPDSLSGHPVLAVVGFVP